MPCATLERARHLTRLIKLQRPFWGHPPLELPPKAVLGLGHTRGRVAVGAEASEAAP